MSDYDYTQFTAEQLTDWYIRNRDYLSERKRVYEAEIEPTEKLQEEIETELRRRLNEAGASSMNTPGGQVVQSTRTVFSAEDKSAFGQFIISSGAWEATQIRPSSEFMREYQEQHKGELPPGVVAYSTQTLSIKRPRSK